MRVFRAPGRVNVIGDHTDYQGGLVLPMAIHLETRVVVDREGGDRVRLSSHAFGGVVDVAADGSDGPAGPLTAAPLGAAGGPKQDWTRYAAAVVWALAEAGRPPIGLEASVESTVPPAAGLSSSAALEVALAVALCAVADFSLPSMDLALACQRAEVEGAGVPCGIMDQAAAVLGSPGGCLFLDCRSLAYEQIALPTSHVVLAVDSGVPRDLATSGYHDRRRETAEAASTIGVPTLREARLEQLDALPDVLRRRARHVVTENARVREFVRALRNGHVDVAGRLLSHSHRSLRDDFESSHRAVDALVDRVTGIHGVAGARITGGGFGGRVVALVEADRVDSIAAELAPTESFVAAPAAGAGGLGA